MARATKREDETLQRLLTAAGEVFSEEGYDAATIRQITDRAQMNVAAVNYHFGDKLQLYREVLTWIFRHRYEYLQARCTSGTPDQRLRAYIEGMLLDNGVDEWPWQRSLTSSAVNDASIPRLRSDIVQMIRPIHHLLREIIRSITKDSLGETTLEMATHEVQSLCAMWRSRRILITALSPQVRQIRDPELVEQTFQMARSGLRHLTRMARAEESAA